MEPDGGFKDAKKLIHHTRSMVSNFFTFECLGRNGKKKNGPHKWKLNAVSKNSSLKVLLPNEPPFPFVGRLVGR